MNAPLNTDENTGKNTGADGAGMNTSTDTTTNTDTDTGTGAAGGAGAGAAPRLECTDVTVRFGGVVAVDHVSLSVPPKSIVGLVGPNGAGKSTLFSVLSGLRRPNTGRVVLDGVDITGMSAQRRARLGLGRTFQHPEMFTGLTVREHLMLTHRLATNRRRVWTDMINARGFRRADSEEIDRVDTLLRALNLTSIQSQTVAGLPLGMSRLVELGRALAGNASVLLLDEPSSGLDANETAQVMDIFRMTVERRGVSLVLVEHDVSMVLNLCDYVNVLDFGSMLASGTPEQIRDNPDVRAAYLGSDTDTTNTDTDTDTAEGGINLGKHTDTTDTTDADAGRAKEQEPGQ